MTENLTSLILLHLLHPKAMSFGIKLRNLCEKPVLRLEETVVKTPQGQRRRMVITKPAAKPRPKRPFHQDTDSIAAVCNNSSSWDNNPFIDDDREAPVLCDPVPLEVFQQVIEANSKVCFFDHFKIVINLLTRIL